MLPKISPQSKSFLVLFAIAVIGSYMSLIVTKFSDLTAFTEPGQNNLNKNYTQINYNQNTTNLKQDLPDLDVPSVSTENWKSYSDLSYHFSFLYPPTWKVQKLIYKNGFYNISINTGVKLSTVNIYISNKSFFAVENLPYTIKTIGGMEAIDIQGILYGFNKNGIYYTFDLGNSTKLKPEFETLVRSVTFN